MRGSGKRRLRFVSSRLVVLSVALVASAVGAGRVIPWAAASTSTGDRAIFEPLPPARILDTRSPSNPLGPRESRILQIASAGGVLLDATAVVLNVTAVALTAGGWLTLYPADAALPPTSNVNFSLGQTVPNSATVALGRVGSDLGKIKIFNSAGQTHVIVDVAGYFRDHNHDDRYYAKALTQARIAANSLTCPAGESLAKVAADGTPTCGTGQTVLTGRINNLRVPNTPGIAAVDYAAPTGVTPPGASQQQVSLGIGAARGKVARDLVVQLTNPPGSASEEVPIHARTFELVGLEYQAGSVAQISTFLHCRMIRDIDWCSSPGPVSLSFIDAIAIRAEAHGLGTAPADAMISLRITEG